MNMDKAGYFKILRNFPFLIMSNVKVLPVAITEIELLVRISRSIFYESFYALNTPDNMKEYMDRAFNPQQLLSELNNPMSEFYFVKVDDMVAGYLKINRGDAQSDVYDDNSLEIERIYVDDHFQGQGLGAKLLEKAIERARHFELRYVWLGVWEKNPGAQRFYERHGFVQFGSHGFRMGDEMQTDLLMKMDLQA